MRLEREPYWSLEARCDGLWTPSVGPFLLLPRDLDEPERKSVAMRQALPAVIDYRLVRIVERQFTENFASSEVLRVIAAWKDGKMVREIQEIH